MYKILFFSFLIVLLNSCCTKEYCIPIINEPSIFIKFSNTISEDLDGALYYKLKSIDYSKVDSFAIEYFNDKPINLTDHFFNYNFDNIEELKQTTFIIKTNFSLDTIYNIDYKYLPSKRKCHSCFLANGKENFIEIVDFSFYYKGVKHYDNDFITITH